MKELDLAPIFQSEDFCKALDIPLGSFIEFSLLGAGEYNINYVFTNPTTGTKLVLRIPTSSQMHLKNQVRYEYESLKLLAPSKRTPKPLYMDDSKKFIPFGFLVMAYLPGNALKYENDLTIASNILADIHNLDPPYDHHLIKPSHPLEAILHECHAMAKVYFDYDPGNKTTKKQMIELLHQGENLIHRKREEESPCIINTELNSGNFLINGKDQQNYLVDWEKPLFAYAGQDLGHFLAPTTTLWKTNTILSKDLIYSFMADYVKYSDRYSDPEKLWHKTLPYFMITCLRGITWCAMAWVEYQSPNRLLKNELTYEKIQTYLSADFLEMIAREYMVL